MATENLFGQYYNTLGTKRSYQNTNFVCNSSTSGENDLIFKDGKAELIDSNGDLITYLDLSQIASGPITTYKTGSIVLNPLEVKLIEGLEYGKAYKQIYFEIPSTYYKIFGDNLNDILNVSFNIIYNTDLDLKEYQIETTLKNDTNNDTLDKRVQVLLDVIGIGDYITVTLEEINNKKYLKFMSQLLGYDFIITNFVFKTLAFDLNTQKIINDFNQTYGLSIEEAEKSIVENPDEIEYNVGKYDNKWLLVFKDPNELADHYYQNFNDFIEPTPKDSSSNSNNSDSSSNSDNSKKDDSSENSDDPFKKNDENIIIKPSITSVSSDKSLDVDTFKYPNGASKVWMLVPEWPTSVNDIEKISLKLNHIKDKITILEDTDQKDLYKKVEYDVYAAERNENERHNIETFKNWQDSKIYEDSNYGSIKQVSHEVSIVKETSKPEIKKTILQPHIGMYRYLDYVQNTNSWLNFGDFYSVITLSDNEYTNEKNLANSIFVYNPNSFPVKINYLIGA